MQGCLFCKIVNKEIPAAFIYEDDSAVGILDLNPRAVGHSMILPKIHVETILELPDNETGKIFNSVKKITALLKQKLMPDGFTIGINHGRIAGQAIEHLHIHVIPRYKEDNGGSIHSVVNNPPKESIENIKNKILKNGN